MKSNTRRTAPKLARTTIAIPAPIYSAGRQRAALDLRSFSNYVAALVQQDVALRSATREEVAA